jgi:hypothetical protein
VTPRRLALVLNVVGFLAFCLAGVVECEPCRKRPAAAPEGGEDAPAVGADS